MRNYIILRLNYRSFWCDISLAFDMTLYRFYIPKISLAIQKYRRIPNISLLVVINGPVAMAGSIPRLFKNKGTKVPMSPATMITATNDIEMANAV